MEGYIQKIELESPVPHPEPVDTAEETAAFVSRVDPGCFSLSAHEREAEVEQVFAGHSQIRAESDEAAEGRTLRPLAVSGAVVGGPGLIDELQAIVGVLDNQLSLCSKPRFVGNRHSCDQLLTRAEELCSRVEFHRITGRSHTSVVDGQCDEWREEAVLAAARRLIRRFPELTRSRLALATESKLKKVVKSRESGPPVLGTNGRSESHTADQHVALVS